MDQQHLGLRDDTCPANTTSCLETYPGLAHDFCCSVDAICVPTDAAQTLLCCASGYDCFFIDPIACDTTFSDDHGSNTTLGLQFVRPNDYILEVCDFGCCPLGSKCAVYQNAMTCSLLPPTTTSTASMASKTSMTSSSLSLTTATVASARSSSAILVSISTVTTIPTATPTPTETATTPQTSPSISKGDIVGIASGIGGGLMAAAMLAWFAVRRHLRKKKEVVSQTATDVASKLDTSSMPHEQIQSKAELSSVLSTYVGHQAELDVNAMGKSHELSMIAASEVDTGHIWPEPVELEAREEVPKECEGE